MVDIDQLVPKDHLLRKIEKVMDYDWLYERLSPYYCHGAGRDGTDPVVLIKMVLIQHLFGIPSLRQTYREIQLNIAYRWFLGYRCNIEYYIKPQLGDKQIPLISQQDIQRKLAMLKEVRDSSAAEARAIAQQRLRDAGVQSVPKQ